MCAANVQYKIYVTAVKLLHETKFDWRIDEGCVSAETEGMVDNGYLTLGLISYAKQSDMYPDQALHQVARQLKQVFKPNSLSGKLYLWLRGLGF